jgi:preprotein translocase subunit SecG
MLRNILTVIHALLAIGLIVGVLMQSSKSAGLGTLGGGGGGGEQVYGKKKGADEILSRISTTFAILFIVTSLVLVYIQSN